MEEGGHGLCEESDTNKLKYRTLFISDVHLGTKGCQADKLIDFLKHRSFEKIYIVGDFIDIWLLKKRLYWPQRHTDVIRKILKRSKKTPVIYINGNHDEFCENFFCQLGNIEICGRVDHITADNRKLLVIHGHQFDCVTKNAKWLSIFGSVAYSILVSMNLAIDGIRKRLGLQKHWSLSSYVKKNIKNAISFIFNFEKALSTYAQSNEYDGVICGHIHTAAIKQVGGTMYYNTGDWVESCTALIEDFDGTLYLVNAWNSPEFVESDRKLLSKKP